MPENVGADQIKKEYFAHLVEEVCDKNHHKVDYIPLLDLLNSIPFDCAIQEDHSRVADGAFLRKKWLVDEGWSDYMYVFEDTEVTVLEVLVALAERIEYQVGNIMLGNHTADRFWELLDNLDISKYSADNYKPLNIREKVTVWMERKFKSDGKGSPFPVKHPEKDLRTRDMWGQMGEYLMEKYF